MNVSRMGVLVLPVVLLSGCVMPQRIQYDLRDTRALGGGALSHYNLVVHTLQDQRDSDIAGRKSKGGECAMTDDGKFYVNGDDAYTDGPVTAAVTNMIAQHIAASGLFNTVSVTEAEPQQSDLLLTGTLKRFEARREAHQTQEALANGLLGIILTSTKVWHARYEATTELSDLRLMQPRTQAILWQGDVRGHIEGDDSVQSTNWVVYNEANLALKDAVDKLLEQLAAAKLPPSINASASDHPVLP